MSETLWIVQARVASAMSQAGGNADTGDNSNCILKVVKMRGLRKGLKFFTVPRKHPDKGKRPKYEAKQDGDLLKPVCEMNGKDTGPE